MKIVHTHADDATNNFIFFDHVELFFDCEIVKVADECPSPAYKGFVPRFPLQSDEESHMSSWKVDDEEVKVGRQWWRALEVALSKERLEVEERVMGKELRAEMEVEEDTGKPTGCSA